MKRPQPRFALFSLFFCSVLVAHEGDTTEHHVEGRESGFVGAIELRPSWESGTGNFFGENIIDFGYRFSDFFQIRYQQEIHNNISLQEPGAEEEGFVHLETGLLKAHLHEIWEGQDGKSSLSLEPRVFLPTSGEEREKGFVTAGLCYLKFRHEVGSTIGVSAMYAPTVFFYSQPGITLGEESESNPTFQHRAQIAFDASLFDGKLSLSVPVLFYLTKHRDYVGGAKHNNVWTSYVGLAPELGYEISPGFSTGIALITPNLLDSQMSDSSVNHGRTSAVSQLIMRASL